MAKSYIQDYHLPLRAGERSVTAQQVAAAWRVSVSTARRELERRVAIGRLDRQVGWDRYQMGRATYGIPQPPPYKVVRYALRGAA